MGKGKSAVKLVAATAILLTLHSVQAQAIRWDAIVNGSIDRLQHTTLSRTQARSVKRMLVRHSVERNQTWCEKGDTSFAENLTASEIPIGAPHAMLLEAGQGCARGAQGANGAMWIIRWQGAKPILLGELSGWPYRVLPHTSHGLRDVTVGWHMSAREFGLALFRFDGKQYRQAGSADVVCDDNDKCKATPRASK